MILKRAFILFAYFASIGLPAARGDDRAAMIEMVRVPGGCFEMGTSGYEKHEQPQHKVCVDNFEIGKYEVTQAQWKAVMGANASKFTSCGDSCPVDQISWRQAQEFARRLSALGKGTFRLPTEAEWEYACRSGGKDEIWPGGVTDTYVYEIAWFDKEAAGNQTNPVGTKMPNGLGIHDMAGNVWEWNADWYDPRANARRAALPSPAKDAGGPAAPQDSERRRAQRGGSFLCHESYCARYRPSARQGAPLDIGTSHAGFRCAASLG